MSLGLAGNIVSEAARSYNSMSGADIRVSIGPRVFSELQGLSYSISREKAPIYTLGSPDPRAYSRNKRGIAGSLVWVNFDRHALLEIIRAANGTFIANRDDVRPEWAMDQGPLAPADAVFNSRLMRNNSELSVGATIDEVNLDSTEKGYARSTTAFKVEATPFYADQVLPFDVTCSACNEMGASAGMKIFGVEILNEGFGTSIDDAVAETQCTWVARAIEPWQATQPLRPAGIHN